MTEPTSGELTSYLLLALHGGFEGIFLLPYNHPWQPDELNFRFKGTSVTATAVRTELLADRKAVRLWFYILNDQVSAEDVSDFITYLLGNGWFESPSD